MNAISNTYLFKILAKMGYAARGAVYLVIGGLAVLAAIGAGGKTTDSKGAILEIEHHSFGVILLVLLVVGLCGYVAWRLVQAVKDVDGHGTSVKGLTVRSGMIASAVSHGFLAIWTIKVLVGGDDNSSEGQEFLATDFGEILIGLTGLVFIGAGLAHIYKGWTARFERYMEIPSDKDFWARPLCRFGLIARGLVWCMVGSFLIKSFLSAKRGELKGMRDALEALGSSSYGTPLLGVTAAGLFAFGIYGVLEAIYRKVDTNSLSVGTPRSFHNEDEHSEHKDNRIP